MLCTLLTEERLSSHCSLGLASNAGVPGEEGEVVDPVRRSWFRKGAGIPGMWPPWGTAWVGLLRQGEELGFD